MHFFCHYCLVPKFLCIPATPIQTLQLLLKPYLLAICIDRLYFWQEASARELNLQFLTSILFQDATLPSLFKCICCLYWGRLKKLNLRLKSRSKAALTLQEPCGFWINIAGVTVMWLSWETVNTITKSRKKIQNT